MLNEQGDDAEEHVTLSSGHTVKAKALGGTDKAAYDAYMQSDFRVSILKGKVHPDVARLANAVAAAAVAAVCSHCSVLSLAEQL